MQLKKVFDINDAMLVVADHLGFDQQWVQVRAAGRAGLQQARSEASETILLIAVSRCPCGSRAATMPSATASFC